MTRMHRCCYASLSASLIWHPFRSLGLRTRYRPRDITHNPLLNTTLCGHTSHRHLLPIHKILLRRHPTLRLVSFPHLTQPLCLHRLQHTINIINDLILVLVISIPKSKRGILELTKRIVTFLLPQQVQSRAELDRLSVGWPSPNVETMNIRTLEDGTVVKCLWS
jgi:hypothetical protein